VTAKKVKDTALAVRTEETKELLGEWRDDYSAAKSAREEEDTKWARYDKYVEDDQWDTPIARDEWKPRPVTNICWEKLQTIHGNTATGKIAATLTERIPGFADEAAKMTDITAYYIDALDFHRKLGEFEWIRPKLGTCVFKSPWNPQKNNGDGDLDLFVVHPGCFFPDPNITNPWEIQRAEFMEFVANQTKRWASSYFDKGRDPLCRFTKAELEELLVADTSSDTDTYDTETTVAGQRERVNVHERWYKDDDDKLQVAWYAGEVLLKDSRDNPESKKNGFYKHGRYPVVLIPYVQKDKRLWGRSELQSLVGEEGKRDGIQDIINKFDQDFIIAIKMSGLGQTAYQHGKIKDPENTLTGEPELLIPVKGPVSEAIAHIQGPGPNPQVMAYREAKMIDADRITKQWDVTQGRATTAIRTATQTLALREEAMKGLTDRVDTLHQGIRELIELWVEHLIEFVTTDREWTKRGEGGVESFMFNPSKLAAMKPRKLVDGAWTETPGESRRVYFNAKVDVGASLSMSESFLFQMGSEMFARKAIDLQGYYDMLPDFPKKQDTLQRMMAQTTGAGQPGTPQGGQGAALAQFVQSLPPEIVQQINALPSPEARTQAVMQLFQQAQGAQPQGGGAVAG
jgi:hypothetical protein